MHKQGVLDWLQSYLTGGRQCIAYNFDNITYYKEVPCSVPQSSVLDPLLFLSYLNDLFKASSNLTPIMFANDTNVFLSEKNIEKWFVLMNTELENISLVISKWALIKYFKTSIFYSIP